MAAEKLTPERRRQRTRDALLDAAEEVFVERGVTGASVEQIAAEAGFSRGAVYDHFGSKEELLLAVMNRFISRQLDQFQNLSGDDPMGAAVDAAETFRKTFSTDLVPIELELRMNALRHQDLRKRLVEADRRLSDENARLVKKMVGGRRMRVPAQDLADIGRAAILGLLVYAAVDEERRSRYESLVETLFVLMTEAVTQPAATRKR